MAQLASAPALGAGGPPFESEYPDTKKEKKAVTDDVAAFVFIG